MNRRRKALAAASATVLTLAVASACTQQQVRDLENVPVQEPEKSELYTNVDQYPNVVAFCIHGVGFISTTRDYTSLQESPGLTESWCKQ